MRGEIVAWLNDNFSPVIISTYKLHPFNINHPPILKNMCKIKLRKWKQKFVQNFVLVVTVTKHRFNFTILCSNRTRICPAWFPNRLISAGFKPVLGHTEKSCITSYYRQFSTNIKIKIIRLITVLLAWAFDPFGTNKTGFNHIMFYFVSAESFRRKVVYNTMR